MSTSTSTLKNSPISIVPVPALRQKQTPSIDRLDAMDMVNTRHHQIQGILASIFNGLDGNDPTQKAPKNAIWAVQEMLDQAQDSVAMLELCGSEWERK